MEKENIKQLHDQIKDLESKLENQKEMYDFYQKEYEKMRSKHDALVSILKNLTILSNL